MCCPYLVGETVPGLEGENKMAACRNNQTEEKERSLICTYLLNWKVILDT